MAERRMDPIDFESAHHGEAERIAQQLATEGQKLVYLLVLKDGRRRIQESEPVEVEFRTFRPI